MTHASLFSGIGGPEIAAAMLGWDNLFHCEINEFGRKVLDYWFPNSKSYEDITKTDFSKWRGKVDVLTGGFPCQPFSYAGKRRGADDDRYLWPEMLRVINEVRPAWVVGENVAGITTMVEPGEVSALGVQATLFGEGDGVHGYRYRQPFTIERVCGDLESLGYSVQPLVVPACAVGAPHIRDRVFIVARRIASDSDNGADRRVSREDEGKGGEERLQERNEIRKSDKSDKIRPEMRRPVADTDNTGDGTQRSCGRERKKVDARGEEQPLAGSGRPRQGLATADAGSERLQTGHSGRKTCKTSRNASGWCSRSDSEDVAERNAADTYGKRPDKPNTASEPSQPQRFHFEENHKRWIAGLGRWDSFPTVSPVHRGNDGIPFDVDRLAIPFSKWRTESLKAYGNAIVPQVMYEIFRFIEIVEKGVEK